ncbi:hypothetical protein ECC02_002354 [Trypanosoma cruzi]|uniref:WW domain-containing protein n=1 Tax=Trypanosoma cruzi TaxID=5693 RepID=A0A7J6YDC8_TRYCR|nr:hypothetical protein ECC02_002354 [Trypanosoma cruzi]
MVLHPSLFSLLKKNFYLAVSVRSYCFPKDHYLYLMSVVLDCVPDASYEPSEAELLEYGKWLGMKFPEDKPFLWIAREGLKAPLPENWKACRSEKGDLYYFNFKTGESNWDHPLDKQFKELLQSEKENPSPQSIAKGAKRLTIEIDNAAETVTEQTETKESCLSSSRGKSRIQKLKTLKLKKELPDNLRLKPIARVNSGYDTSERGSEPVGVGKRTGSKACSILKQNIEKLSTERSEESLSSEKVTFEADLNDELRQFQSEKLREHQAAKDEYEMKLKDSWKRYQKLQTEEYEKKMNSYKDELEKKLFEEKNNLEENYSTSVQKFGKEVAARVELEAKQMRHYLSEKYEKEKSDIEKGWQEELENFRRSNDLELDRLRASNSQSVAELKQVTDELWENALYFVETYKKAQDAFVEELTNTKIIFSKFGEHALSKLIENARELYNTELNEIKDSFQSEIEKIRCQFLEEIVAFQRKRKLLLEEKEKYDEENETLLNTGKKISDCTNLKHCMTHITQRQEQDSQENTRIQGVIEKRGDFASEIKGDSARFDEDTMGVRSEKELFESVVTYMKEVQRKELEAVKRDLKQRAEEELKATLDEVVRDRLHLGFEPLPEEKDEIFSFHGSEKALPEIKTEEKESEKERLSTALSDTIKKDDLTDVLTEALRRLFAGSPFIIPSPKSGDAATVPSTAIFGAVNGANGKQTYNAEGISVPCRTEVNTLDGFPVSFQEQKMLLAGEHQRVAEGKRFVENQRFGLEERRQQLKMARHQWKQDVRTAKEEGVRASSKRGKLLNKIRIALENQARGLERDESILRDSERWLLMKEQSVYQMEKHIKELEEGKGRDTSINSIDTVGLVTDFFKPTMPSSGFYSPNHDTMHGVVRKRDLDPIYTKTLDKIARRLEEVTSMMNIQKQKRSSSLPYENLPRRRSAQKPTKGA